MKKILIQSKNLLAGGIETSLLNFLKNLQNDFDFDLFLFNKTGVLMDRLPNSINTIEGGKILKYLSRDCQSSSIGVTKKRKNPIKAILKFLGVKQVLKSLALIGQKQKKKYDIAITFNGLDELNSKFILKKVKADKKFAFIHCDVENVKFSNRIIKLLNKFDKVFCVSESCMKQFNGKYPFMSNKTDFLYNIQDVKQIQEMANKINIEKSDKFVFLTVARMAPMKAPLRYVNVVKRLVDDGYKNFKCVWVGAGDELVLVKDAIQKFNLQNYFDCVGNQGNPYPFIKTADCFVLPSAFGEACPMVYAESMCLGVPVLSTENVSAHEILDGLGIICKNSEDGIYSSMKEILDDVNRLYLYRKNLMSYKFDLEAIKDKFKKICEDK